MAAPAPVRAFAAIGIAVVAVATPGPPAAAVEGVPREGGGVLPGRTHAAIVGDVDGDGVRELIRLVPWDANPGQLALEVIAMRGDVPRFRGQVLVERAASVEDYVAGRNPNEDALLPLSASDPARLVAWRDGGHERILLATMQGDPGSAVIERSCCLTLWWVELDANGGTRARYVQNTAASGAWILAVDMDADGTDELAVVETPNPAIPTASEVLVLRWNGRDFDRLRSTAQEGLISGPLNDLGDSDGLPGHEVGYVAQPGSLDATAPTVHRVALVDGELRIDRTELPEIGSVAPIAGERGGRLALVSARAVHLLRWPAAAMQAAVVATSARGGEALGVLGSGKSARLLVLRGGAVDLLDTALESRQGVAGGEAAAWFTASTLPPFSGELQGGDDAGGKALVFAGRLISAPEGPSNQASIRDVAVLAGKTPVGLFGDGLAWAAVGGGPALPVERRGGGLLVGASARASDIAVVPAEALLSAEADGGLLEPTLTGGLLEDSPSRPILITGGQVRGRFVVPPGSVVRVKGNDAATSQPPLSTGLADVLLISAEESDRNATFSVRLLVSTPAGHGYGAIWQARVLREAPPLRASAPFAALAFNVSITGRTALGAELLVDGARVAVAPDGSFSADVDAGLLPRAVRIAATDRVGNTSEIVVEVVAPIDYRQLPWIPIIVVLTLAVAAFLFLRTPRPTAVGAQHPDEGVLEEIQ